MMPELQLHRRHVYSHIPQYIVYHPTYCWHVYFVRLFCEVVLPKG